MSSFDRFDEYRKRKYDYRNLLRALPKLPEPEALLEKIVDTCRNVMYQCAVLVQLHDEIPFFSQTNEPWGELERDAHLVEQKAENCELRFLLLRQTLRTVHASPPILITTRRISKAAWESMEAQPQVYSDAEGREHKLAIAQDTMEAIIADQLKAVSDLYMTIRNMRATALNEERALRDSTQETMAKTISAMQKSLDEMSSQINLGHARSKGYADRERSARTEDDYMEVEEPELSAEEAEKSDYIRLTLLARIHVLEIRIHSMEQEKPCQIREYASGVNQDNEAKMRCSFCGRQGIHYSDSCLRVRDSVRRKILLKKQHRCKTCLEVGCMADSSCSKFWNRCFHCDCMGDHSAVCDWPDKAEEIEEEIRETVRELSKARKKVSAICRRLGVKDDF